MLQRYRESSIWIWDLMPRGHLSAILISSSPGPGQPPVVYEEASEGSTARRSPTRVFLAFTCSLPLTNSAESPRFWTTVPFAPESARRQVLSHLDILTRSIFRDV